MKHVRTLTIPENLLCIGCQLQCAIQSEGWKVTWAKKKLRYLVRRTAWKTGGVRHLEKVHGKFDGRGCLRKVLARLHVRLPGGLGWDWCLEKGLGGVLGKSACKVTCEVAIWAGLGLVLGNSLRVDAQKKCLAASFVIYQTSCYVSLKVCSGCSSQEMLGESSSNSTTAHHHVEAMVVSMGQLKKPVANTRKEM